MALLLKIFLALCTTVSVALTQCTDGDVRLVGGGFYYGELELCYSSMWWKVCLKNAVQNDMLLEVACRQLGIDEIDDYLSVVVNCILRRFRALP